ncbi:MAG: hypothetical protein ACRDAX_04645, partial [Propionibacteriaceae bacterium]
MQDIAQILSDIKLQSSTVPPVYRFGDNYLDWERHTRRHLECFAAREWPIQLARCLSVEAEQTLSVANLFPVTDIETLMSRIRHVLGPRGHRLDNLQKVLDMKQATTENIYQFARRLLDAVELAIPTSAQPYRDGLVLDKFCLGVLSKIAQQRFREKTASNLEEALELARIAEMQEVPSSDSCIAAVQRTTQSRPTTYQVR